MRTALFTSFSFSYTSYLGYFFSYFRKACGVECN